MKTFDKVKLNENKIKIIKILGKNPNITFHTLQHKITISETALEHELFEMWAENLIQKSNRQFIDSTYQLEPWGERFKSIEIIKAKERMKERVIGFIMGVLSSIVIYVITTIV